MMRQLPWAVLILLATTAAGPVRPSSSAGHGHSSPAPAKTAQALPVPPVPPAHPPTDQSAPVPDLSAAAPLVPGPQGAQIGLTDFRTHRYDHSAGYTPGSQFQTSEEKRAIQTPGLRLRVPLQ
jgi:hypothetical protein